MKSTNRTALKELTLTHASTGRFLLDTSIRIPLCTHDPASRLRRGVSVYSDTNVFIRTRSQISTVIALLALDGIAKRMIICPPDISDKQIPRLFEVAESNTIVSDADIDTSQYPQQLGQMRTSRNIDTEWVLFTSGTSGFPKLVLHTLSGLMAPIHGHSLTHAVWSTFYDIRRYGGLQILLRALVGNGSIVLSDSGESVSAFLSRLGIAGVTHISGTPSHWRRVLMTGSAKLIAPAYIRLSGEMPGQDILDRLQATYPNARIGHAFASTEAGVVFTVNDGQEGFPASLLAKTGTFPIIRIKNNSLCVRSDATARRYIGKEMPPIADSNGFVDTGDIVKRAGERYVFVGRREGVVNIGGQKVHPEEVEAAINRHPAVAASRVWARSSPITGMLIAADVSLTPRADRTRPDFAAIRSEIITTCRAYLAPHKVPVQIYEVEEIPILNSGKIERRHA